ncbi:putative type IV fimbrial biogenesis protein PilV [Moraxella macacae 0408225]|uniref:Putative type IV fimbrial biogenesis protein PilV n=1 Tax=Moraxella macacae 0408225 TaxID=1230338 RepID=L2F6D6_9GAMM|nr:type IV pilus modification protein PilV [Moraxella macacae]ELA08614.1 putative type IV fimbrial biogenesis protein PilV [Moraxella macacae 0408225]
MKQTQQGMGFVEVLVALLLLAVAVLGFSGMQMTAVKATDESLLRSRALSVMRGGAEMLRANPSEITAFKNALNNTPATAPGNVSDTERSKQKTDIQTKLNKCKPVYDKQKNQNPTACSFKEMAERDANALRKVALDNEIAIRMDNCPGTTKMQCMIASWGETAPVIGTNNDACMVKSGSYRPGATCFVMEAY